MLNPVKDAALIEVDPTAPVNVAAADEIITQAEAARLLRMSVRQVQRLDELGEFAPRIRLSTRRVGYWKQNCLAWARARTAASEQAA